MEGGGMYKKIFIGLAVLVCVVVLAAGMSFAKNAGTSGAEIIDIGTIYMVDSYGSTVQQNFFDLGATPWVYFELPSGAGSQNIAIQTSWNYDGELQDFFSMVVQKGTTEVWYSADDWDSMQALGTWCVVAQYDANSPFTSGKGTAKFTVTPEPVSSVLFLAGSATLGFRHFRKKRMNA